MGYYITVGNKVVLRNIKTKREASAKCGLIMGFTPRLDVFYHRYPISKEYINEKRRLKKVI